MKKLKGKEVKEVEETLKHRQRRALEKQKRSNSKGKVMRTVSAKAAGDGDLRKGSCAEGHRRLGFWGALWGAAPPIPQAGQSEAWPKGGHTEGHSPQLYVEHFPGAQSRPMTH